MCKHEWQAAIPTEEVPADKRATLVVLCIANANLSRTYYCPLCRATGHGVYGRRIQRHTGDWGLRYVNEARERLALAPLPAPTEA